MKVYNWVVIDIASGQIIDEDSFEYHGEVAQLKGGGGGSESKPLPLDAWMKSGPYAWLQDYFGEIQQEYPPMQALTDYLAQQQGLIDPLTAELTGAGGSIAQQRGILENLQTPEMMRAAMDPYLGQAYGSIGQAGIPSSSYADAQISNAVTQGWLNNMNNTLSGYGNLTSQQTSLADKIGGLQSNAYNMMTQPINWISEIQKSRYGQSISKSSGGGKSGISLGL